MGLEPVAVAVRENRAGTLDVWVVNHLSDSVSIVRVDPTAPERARVMGTLQVGDEPRDIVFAGSGRSRAFVTTARRGQNLPAGLGPEFDTPGVGRALVWAFDADDPFADTAYDADASPSPAAGEPLSVIELFGDSPRALAVSPDGSRVYAAIFLSGNQTTIVGGPAVETGGLPPPPQDSPFYPDNFPLTGLIVRRDPASGAWRDELARDWGPSLYFFQPDADVFTIDVDAGPPALIPGATVAGVGTVLYAMAVHPTDGTLFVANTEARNEIRFEPLIDATHGLQGRFVDNRITVISPTGGVPAVRAVGLNPHADHTRPTGPASEVAESLALPTAIAFSADGRRLYATAFDSETDRDPGFCRARRRGRQSDDRRGRWRTFGGWPSTSSGTVSTCSIASTRPLPWWRPPPSRRRRASPRPSAWDSTRRHRP